MPALAWMSSPGFLSARERGTGGIDGIDGIGCIGRNRSLRPNAARTAIAAHSRQPRLCAPLFARRVVFDIHASSLGNRLKTAAALDTRCFEWRRGMMRLPAVPGQVSPDERIVVRHRSDVPSNRRA